MSKKTIAPEVLTEENGPEAEPTVQVITAENWNSEMVAFAQEQQSKKTLDPVDWQAEFDRRKQHNSPEAVKARAEAREKELLESTALEAAAADLVAEARTNAPSLAQAEADESAALNQMAGMFIYAQGMEVTNKLAKLRVLEQLKKAKNYKNLPIKTPDGQIARPKNFSELCEVFGMSRASVDRDLENIAAFGEGVLLAQKSLGIGYRDLRVLKAGLSALPEAQKEEVKELIAMAANSGDKEEILAALDEMGVRNAKLSKERDEALARVEAQQKLQTKTAKRANELEIKLEQALNPADEDERQQTLRGSRASFRSRLDLACNSLVGNVTTLCNSVINARRADTERDASDNNSGPMIDAQMWEYINSRLSLTCQSLRGLILDAGLEVDFAAEFTGELPFDFEAAEPFPLQDQTDETGETGEADRYSRQ